MYEPEVAMDRKGRGGVSPDGPELLAVAAALCGSCVGALTHAGYSYACRSIAEIEALAEVERDVAVRAARRLRDAGVGVEIVSVGSTPTNIITTGTHRACVPAMRYVRSKSTIGGGSPNFTYSVGGNAA